MVQQGLGVLVLGMATVFAFLFLLWGAVGAMSAITGWIDRLGGEGVVTAADDDDEALLERVARVAAAVHHRRNGGGRPV